MEERAHIVQARMGALQPPAAGTEIRVGPWRRWRIISNFRHFLKAGRQYRIPYIALRTALAGLFSVVLGVGAVALWGEVFSTVPFVSKQPDAAVAAILAATAFIALLTGFSIVRAAIAQASPPHGGEKKVFDRDRAPVWSERAKDAAQFCERKLCAEIAKLHDDRDNPYRILRGFAPAPSFSLLRPVEYIPGGLGESARKRRQEALFELDALCGGVLKMVGARPEPRFTDGGSQTDPVVSDLYWRADVQEIQDTNQADIFLRFHQSTVERAFASTCRYKSYAALNNFRRTPILLLRVRDVIDCLRNRDGEYDDQHALIFKGLTEINADNVIEALTTDAYQRHPPRIERVYAQNYASQPGPILFEGEEGDWVMMFDPARVWVRETVSNTQHYIEAIAALRSAIHFASRKHTIEVVLKKRDVLMVGNRRIMVARQEERPAISIRDAIASKFRSLEGRWLRKIYGFPHSDTDIGDNFIRLQKNKESSGD